METTHEAYEFEHREARARHRAVLRADARVRFADELLRYVLATTLLVVLVRPIGVIVGLVWGFRLVRRAYRREVEPKLRRRVLRQELRRARHGGACAGRRGRAPRSADDAEDLAERMGDDPDAREARDWARGALRELEGAEDATGREETVRVADLVDDAVDVFEERAERSGLNLRVDVDSDGEVVADPERLRALLMDLVGESVFALQEGTRGPARIHVEMGENLAGSEVWVRIRDDRSGAAAGARGTYGSRPVAGVAGATLETHASPEQGVERILTLRKQPVLRPTEDSPTTNGAA